LADSDAELLRLVVFEDLEVTAAASVLGISAGAAHTRLHRIRRKVQRWISTPQPPPAEAIPTIDPARSTQPQDMSDPRPRSSR
jgi:predicted DNA-binding protein (UPF0251 family)